MRGVVDPFTAPRKRQTGPATLGELQALVQEAADYLDRCGMDAAAQQLRDRAFGDGPEDIEDVFGNPLEGEAPPCVVCPQCGQDDVTDVRAFGPTFHSVFDERSCQYVRQHAGPRGGTVRHRSGNVCRVPNVEELLR